MPKFESLSGGTQASLTVMTQAEIQDKLLELLKLEEKFDAVLAWIESNVGERTKEPAFVRTLMTAICKNAISEAQPSNKLTIDTEKLNQYKLLSRYVDGKEELELQCLYAAQALVTQLSFPQGFILNIFNLLWDDALISTEAFHAWFNSEDPQESEGREVCKKSLAAFQTLLSEEDDEDDEANVVLQYFEYWSPLYNGDRGSSSRSSSQQRTSSQPTSRDSSLARGRLENERINRVPTPSSLSDTSPSDDQPPSDVTRNVEEGPVCKIKRVEDPDELDRVVKNLLQEFLADKNIEEATLAVMDYFDRTNIVNFTREVLLFMFDRMQGHQLVSQLLGHLLNTNYMKKHHFISAFAETLELCPDLIVDIPTLWVQVGTLVAHILLTEAVTFKDIAEPLKVIKGKREAGVLLKQIIQVLVKEKGPTWIRDHWNRHGVSWSDFLEEKDISDFVTENKFESFSGGTQASSTVMTQAEIQDKLLEMIKLEENFNAVIAWIESNVGERTKEPAFVRTLMTAICKSAISEAQPSNKLTIDTEKLKHYKLLSRYVDGKEELELQCLYAAQALVTQLSFPQGFILNIFNLLWDDALISNEAFRAWFNSEDPQESEGREVCKKSLAAFQTLLSEEDDEDDVLLQYIF